MTSEPKSSLKSSSAHVEVFDHRTVSEHDTHGPASASVFSSALISEVFSSLAATRS